MQFIQISKARGLKAGAIMFVEMASGERREAKLISRTEDETGQKFVFETPAYFNKQSPSINPILISDVVSVCILKNGNGNKD